MANDARMEQFVRDYYAAMNSGDQESVWQFFEPDVIYEDRAVGHVYNGLGEYKNFANAYVGALGLKFYLEDIHATDRGFGIAWRMDGTHNADLPGMPATGRSFSVQGATIATVANGRIKHNIDYWNLGTLLEQLGLAEPARTDQIDHPQA